MKLLNNPIEMVAVFFTDRIRPIRFRLKDEEGYNQVIKIKHIRTTDSVKVAGVEYIAYTCIVEINSLEKICEVRFCKMTMIWYLYKI